MLWRFLFYLFIFKEKIMHISIIELELKEKNKKEIKKIMTKIIQKGMASKVDQRVFLKLNLIQIKIGERITNFELL